MSEKTVGTSGLQMLKDLAVNYPYVVQVIVYIGVAYGLWLIKKSLDQMREKASAGIGIGQSEKEIGKRATNNMIFGVVFINFLWFLQLLMNTLALGSSSGDVNDPTDYINRDIFESASGASDMLMYVIWSVNLLGFWWLFRGTFILHASIDNPHKYEKWVALKLYGAAIIALQFKWVMSVIANWLHLDFVSKWLGMG